MNTFWYIVKVLPGKERKLTDELNRQITVGKIVNILRFIAPTEKYVITSKNKRVVKEKVIYSGYLYFESTNKLSEDELELIALTPNFMVMNGSKLPVLMRNNDVLRILKDEILERHLDAKMIRYTVGEKILMTDGPFESFEGMISEIQDENVVVEVKIFGRGNKITLTQGQIQKIQ